MRKTKAAELVDRIAGPPPGFTPKNYGPALAKEGDTVQGKYLGAGKAVSVKRRGKMVAVPTYRVKDTDRGEIAILGADQIARFFAEVKVGQEVWIRKRGQRDTASGNRVNVFDFAVR